MEKLKEYIQCQKTTFKSSLKFNFVTIHNIVAKRLTQNRNQIIDLCLTGFHEILESNRQSQNLMKIYLSCLVSLQKTSFS